MAVFRVFCVFPEDSFLIPWWFSWL